MSTAACPAPTTSIYMMWSALKVTFNHITQRRGVAIETLFARDAGTMTYTDKLADMRKID